MVRRLEVWCRDRAAASLFRPRLRRPVRLTAPLPARSHQAPTPGFAGPDLRRVARAGGTLAARRTLLRLALGSGLVTLLIATTLLSPALRVRTVVWTGGAPIPAGVCRRVEARALGQPLFVLPEKQLRRLIEADVEVVRRPPSTLELRSQTPTALAVLPAGHLVRGDGRVTAGDPTTGLVRLEGIEIAVGDRVAPPVREFLQALRRELGAGPLSPRRALAQGDEWELWLAGGNRVRLLATDVEAQLRKLRVFEQGLRHESLPALIDLRFAEQVVGRNAEGRGRRG